jgi:hypothetical protein
MAIQFINAFLGWYETVKAADAVAALKASLKPVATCKRDGQWQNMDAAELVPGDLVLLAAGSSIPADCLINHGARRRFNHGARGAGSGVDLRELTLGPAPPRPPRRPRTNAPRSPRPSPTNQAASRSTSRP